MGDKIEGKPKDTMGLEVEFVLLGKAAEYLNVPPGTLRSWTDQLEEQGVHYVKRNNRNERIYYKSDLDILRFVRDLRNEYGRQTTARDIANLLKLDGRFQLRSKEDAPSPVDEPSNRIDLLSHEDIKELMASERVRQFVKVIVDQTTKNLKDELIKEMRESIKKEMESKLEEERKMQQETIQAINDSNEKILSRVETYGKKGWLSKLFGF